MKKLLALILAALMLFSITACNTTQNNLDDKDDDTQNIVNNNEGGDSNNPSDNNPSDNNPSNSDDFVKIGKIVDGYHEGLMFIENYANMGMHTMSCIDKTGKTVFSIEASYIISGFHNGLAFVMRDKAVLCDKTPTHYPQPRADSLRRCTPASQHSVEGGYSFTLRYCMTYSRIS